MTTFVLLVVLLAALLHATWNAVVKSSSNQSLDIVLVTSGAALLSAAGLPFLPAPLPASWPYIAASVAVHVVYFLMTGAAYRSGDMSHAYPLMRGAPPLLVAVASGPLIGQRLSPEAWCGILLVCGGILALLLADKHISLTGRTTRLALTNAVVIATYTLIDGTGVRLSGHFAAYTMYIFLLTAPFALMWSLRQSAVELRIHFTHRWHFGLIGGGCTLGAYILVLWAMTQAPVAMVAAIRETAIIFGTAISGLVLKERFGWSRPVAAAIILLGVIAIKLA